MIKINPNRSTRKLGNQIRMGYFLRYYQLRLSKKLYVTVLNNRAQKLKIMNVIRNLTTAVLAFLILTVSYANEGTATDKRLVRLLPCDRQGVYKLLYVNHGPEKIKVKIFNQEGRLIHKEKMEVNKGFMKPYNLGKYMSGDFRFEITDQYGTVELSTASKEIKADESSSAQESQAQVRLLPGNKEGVYKLLVVTDGIDQIEVKIFNQEGRLIRKEWIQTDRGFMQPYDLGTYQSGNFRFEVTDQHGTTKLNTAH